MHYFLSFSRDFQYFDASVLPSFAIVLNSAKQEIHHDQASPRIRQRALADSTCRSQAKELLQVELDGKHSISLDYQSKSVR